MSGKKLKPEAIQKVKELLVLRVTEREIANSVGMSQYSVHRIKKGHYDTGGSALPKKAKCDLYDYSFI